MTTQTIPPREKAERIVLPRVLIVGFAGRARPPHDSSFRDAVREFLSGRAKGGDQLCCVVNLATHAGRLFAETSISLGVPVRVLLPCSQEHLLQICEDTIRPRLRGVLEDAISIEIIGGTATPEEKLYECALETVLQSQVLLAIADRETKASPVETEEAVSFAVQIRRPVFLHNFDQCSFEPFSAEAAQLFIADPELNFLNALADCDTAPPAVPGRATAEAWLAKLDANALRVAPQVRRLAALPIICTALAAFVSGAGQRMLASGVWVGAGAALGLVAALLPAAVRLGKRQALWVRIRTAAEISRSILALWNTPTLYQVVGPEILPELAGMIRSLNLLKSQCAKRLDLSLDDFKQQFLEERILDQKQYFARQARKSAIKARQYKRTATIASAMAIAASIWTFASRSLFHTSFTVSGGSWLPLVASALFQVATVAGALVVVHDCDRRQRRYQQLDQSLAEWEMEFRAYKTWPPILNLVGKVERALLVELLEWRSLLQNTKMPRN